MKFRDPKVKKFFNTIIHLSETPSFYEVPSYSGTRYETLFIDGYINGEHYNIAMINYEIMPVELVIRSGSLKQQFILDLWERCINQ